MCGIIGILSTENSKHIEAANALISHRGPDDQGLFLYENLALAHQRLSILDLSKNGHQPMISADQNYILVFNGEIYNHQEIRDRILNKYPFKSNSDSETLLYAFQEHGSKIFKELNGIFAFAIFNKKDRQIVVCRDHFGIKPLYYYHKDNEFYFSSEIKSFLKIPSWDKV